MGKLMRSAAIFLVVASLVAGGCFGNRGSKGAENMPPKYHAWSPIATIGGEEQGYSLYTYVIMDGNSNTRTSDGKRNVALINAITNPRATPGEAVTSPGSEGGVSRQECNIFQIPLTQAVLPQFASALSLFNLPLAQQLVAMLVRSMQDDQDMSRRLLYSTPFLVASPVPLPELRYRPARVLIADLTSVDPADMEKVVAAFRQPQSANAADDLEHFRPVRLSLYGETLPSKYISIIQTLPAERAPMGGYGY